ncbi:MAG: TolC family protein [Verrucomicrobiaceae bacterium]|nr:TolC family protein [Verrucomicrobiaceae bacterium]
MKNLTRLLPALLLLTTAQAENAVTSSDLVNEALAKNPEIRFYAAEIDAARGGRQSAGQLANPELSTEFGGMSLAQAKEGLVWRASILQVFDFPGRMALRKAIADRDIELALLGLQQFKSQLANEVRARAGDVLLLQRKEAAARSVRERLESLVEVLVQRDTGSVSALLERRILEATLLNSDRILTDASKAAREASAALNVLCGRGPDQPVKLAGAVTAFPDVPQLLSLKQQAARTNFDLQQKRLQVAKQGLKVDLTKSERWGDITFGPYMAGQHAGGTQIEGGFVFSIPLPLWNKNKGNIDAEKARTQQAEALLGATLRDLERDLAVARAAYLAELDALSRWRPESEKQFADAAAEADRHYRLGAVPAATYVEMQRGYLDAMDSLIESRRNAWKHRMEIERLTGGTLTGESVTPRLTER